MNSILFQDISDSNDMTSLRSMIGLCPQHNILFDNLTCAEHLKLFGLIKGVERINLSHQVRF